jgi:hypothetical protein
MEARSVVTAPISLIFASVIALSVACGGGSDSGPGTTAPTPQVPAAPTGLTATSASPTSIALTWVRNSSNETGFQIERSDGANGAFNLIATTAAGATTYSDAGLAANTTYNYRVRAVGSTGPSAYSNVASLTTPVACPAPTAITHDIGVATNLTAGAPGCVHYHVTGAFLVSAALTIQAGTVISFGPGGGLTVSSGSLSAVGTPTARIRFAGDQAVRGYWRGISIWTASAANEMSYVDVSYGGGGTGTNASDVEVTTGAQLRLSHAVLEQSGGVGLYLGSTAILAAFTVDTLRNNANAGIRLPDRLIGALDNTSDYVRGNGAPFIDAYAWEVSSAQTWQVTSAPIHFSGRTLVSAALNIAPGVSIQFGADAGMTVSTGSLSAVGTATSRIQFSPQTQVRGYWHGLSFWTSSAANHLSFVNVSYGGGGTGTNSADVVVTSGAQLRLDNTVLEQSGGVGLYTEGTANLPLFSTNTFRDNADVGVRVPDQLVGSLDAGSEYASGNGAAYVDAYAWNVSTAQTWRVTSVPIRFTGQTIISAPLTLVPGTTILFRSGGGWSVFSGSLTAIGTAASRIRLLGELSTRGYWRGLVFSTTSAANELTFTEIAYAGGSSGTNPANIDVTSGGTLRLTNSNIHDGAGWGLYLELFGTVTPTPLSSAGNVFTNNSLGPSNVP